MYNLFMAYPMSFAGERGWGTVESGLPLLSVLVGTVLGGVLISFTTNTFLAPNAQEDENLVRLEHCVLTPQLSLTTHPPRPHPGNAPPPHDARRPLPFSRNPLVRLDKLSDHAPQCLAANSRRRPHRARNSTHQHARSEIHCRLLWDQRQLGGGGNHVHALALCFCVSGVCEVDICVSRRAMGEDDIGFVLLLWK